MSATYVEYVRSLKHTFYKMKQLISDYSSKDWTEILLSSVIWHSSIVIRSFNTSSYIFEQADILMDKGDSYKR